MTEGLPKKPDGAEKKDIKNLLEVAKTTVREDPKAVASIILEWLKNDRGVT